MSSFSLAQPQVIPAKSGKAFISLSLGSFSGDRTYIIHAMGSILGSSVLLEVHEKIAGTMVLFGGIKHRSTIAVPLCCCLGLGLGLRRPLGRSFALGLANPGQSCIQSLYRTAVTQTHTQKAYTGITNKHS